MRPLTLAQACAKYPHRFTMQHVPSWAKNPAPNGKFYAPQYRTDAEWYACTFFKGEHELADSRHCYSTGQTWPVGHWLDSQFVRG